MLKEVTMLNDLYFMVNNCTNEKLYQMNVRGIKAANANIK